MNGTNAQRNVTAAFNSMTYTEPEASRVVFNGTKSSCFLREAALAVQAGHANGTVPYKYNTSRNVARLYLVREAEYIDGLLDENSHFLELADTYNYDKHSLTIERDTLSMDRTAVDDALALLMSLPAPDETVYDPVSPRCSLSEL